LTIGSAIVQEGSQLFFGLLNGQSMQIQFVFYGNLAVPDFAQDASLDPAFGNTAIIVLNCFAGVMRCGFIAGY